MSSIRCKGGIFAMILEIGEASGAGGVGPGNSHRLFLRHGRSLVSKLFSNYKFPSCLQKALFTLAHTKNKLFLYLSKCHVIGVRDRLLWIDVF